MDKKNLQEEIEKVWPQVRKRFLFPETPFPVAEDFESAWPAMQIQKRQIQVNTLFIEAFRKVLSIPDLLNAILTHGLAHHVICPWDLESHLNLFLETVRILKNPQLSQIVTDIFLDTVVNDFCFKQGWQAFLLLLKVVPKTTYEKAIYPLYQNLWNKDLDVKEQFFPAGTLDYLNAIEYLDKNHWERSIRKFARAFRPYLEKLRMDSISREPLMGGHNLLSYRPVELEQSMQKLARKTREPAAFSEKIEVIKKGLGNSSGEGSKGKMGYSLGVEEVANTYYYMSRAEKYQLPVTKLAGIKDGALYPYSHEKWEISDPFNDVDIWNSQGKFLPSLTVKWNKRDGEIRVPHQRVPDCLILIDSSASMPDPSVTFSFAVLGAGCAVDAYLREDARVSVYNFSNAPAGNKKMILESQNRLEIYKSLCTYYGGGTVLEMADLEEILNKRCLDVFLMTDMEIMNLERLIDFFKEQKQLRVTAVYIGGKKGVERFQKAAKGLPHVAVFGINEQKDILKIVLGQVKSYLGGNTKDKYMRKKTGLSL